MSLKLNKPKMRPRYLSHRIKRVPMINPTVNWTMA